MNGGTLIFYRYRGPVVGAMVTLTAQCALLGGKRTWRGRAYIIMN
jgi:hypothetical protein